ncbi:MAG TPA: tRNA (N6-isopentenyl adenosine(37)-C2)-methylthiotransferase MiaB [Candidatus Polarisedimenticolaceae bacterium]|nr:tRNA (N6-isopentenyl adenosine(37)-C2)-methylthiotransferase MiaB [Candidatus Polarisedimenticolaceae bacterium]
MSGSDGAAGSYYIETWGCQMNVLDSAKLSGSLEQHGYRRVERADQADVVLLNTCAIREKAEEKVYSELGRLRPLKDARPDLILGVCGCVAQREGEAVFSRAPYVDLVVGTRATASLPILVERLRSGDASARHTADVEIRDDSIRFAFDEIRREAGASRAYVTIIEGCNHRCTFCVVPSTRGREMSRDLDDVLAEVRTLAARGIVEVEFLGQTVNAYRDAAGRQLGDLLVAASRVDGIARLRFTTSHPAQMTDRLLDRMAEARPKLCPYLHLPVQSGSSRILSAMRRGYDREGYLDRLRAVRSRIPEMCFGTDVIVGFPGEGEGDFEATLDLLREVEFDTVYSFTYSARQGTPAAAMGEEVPEPLKFERLARLQAQQQGIQARRARRWIGRDLEVLVDGPSKRDRSVWSGRTPEARLVHFPGVTVSGRIETVRIEEATPYSLRGKLQTSPS